MTNSPFFWTVSVIAVHQGTTTAEYGGRFKSSLYTCLTTALFQILVKERENRPISFDLVLFLDETMAFVGYTTYSTGTLFSFF
jgi:hypothetical protein